MITSCIIFLATLGTADVVNENDYINEYQNCLDNVPKVMYQYADLFYEFFDEENISTAVRIGWCESRGKETAYNSGANDSGVMQFVPWTWNWVAEKMGSHRWGEWSVMYDGRPYLKQVSKSSLNFEIVQVQFSSYYNILYASYLAEDIYGSVRWDDWQPSKWCWSDESKWIERWKRENA